MTVQSETLRMDKIRIKSVSDWYLPIVREFSNKEKHLVIVHTFY